jgi:WD40 repeat protein
MINSSSLVHLVRSIIVIFLDNAQLRNLSEPTHSLKTFAIENICNGLFLPGCKHILLSTKDGHLYLIEVLSGEIIQKISAHKGEIWGLTMHINPNAGDGDMLVASGGSDKTMKLWNIVIKEFKQPNSAKPLKKL